jgi:hypothetical protein
MKFGVHSHTGSYGGGSEQAEIHTQHIETMMTCLHGRCSEELISFNIIVSG